MLPKHWDFKSVWALVVLVVSTHTLLFFKSVAELNVSFPSDSRYSTFFNTHTLTHFLFVCRFHHNIMLIVCHLLYLGIPPFFFRFHSPTLFTPPPSFSLSVFPSKAASWKLFSPSCYNEKWPWCISVWIRSERARRGEEPLQSRGPIYLNHNHYHPIFPHHFNPGVLPLGCSVCFHIPSKAHGSQRS